MLSTPPEKGSDLDANVLDCYVMCCQAEAQEGNFFHFLRTVLSKYCAIVHRMSFGSVC